LWAKTDNWVGGTVATGSTSTAYFTNAITAARTVTNDTDWTVGTNTFTPPSTSIDWVLTNAGNVRLTCQRILVNGASTGYVATIYTPLNGNLSKTGAGTLRLGGSNTFGRTTVSAGVLELLPSGYITNTATSGSIAVGGAVGTTLLLTGGKLVSRADSSVQALRVGYKNALIGQVIQTGGVLEVVPAGSIPSFISGSSSDANGWSASSVGTYEISGGTFLTKDLYVGASGIGTLTQTGGAITDASYLYIGKYSATAPGGTGTVSIVGGAVSTLYATELRVGNYGVGTMTISNSAAVVAINGTATLGTVSPALGTLNLYAGTLRLTSLVKGTGTQTFNFSGGTLEPYNVNATIGSVTLANNTTITLAGTNATISSSDKDGTARKVSLYSMLTGSGAITFTGNGTNIVIAADNDYTGNTTVNGGTVVWSNACLSANANLICTNSPKLILAFTGTNTIRKLFVNGFTQKPGIYNSANAPAGMTIQDTGALSVTASEASGTVLIIN
jgi:autotransporter-associated beta strand protein/T5SS/PEP-CTERM-associated repeat protein